MSCGSISSFSWKILLWWKKLACVGKLVWSFMIWMAALLSGVRIFKKMRKSSRRKVGCLRIQRVAVFQAFCLGDFWLASTHHRVSCVTVCSASEAKSICQKFHWWNWSFHFSSLAFEFNIISFSWSTCIHCNWFDTLNKVICTSLVTDLLFNLRGYLWNSDMV